MYNIHLGVLPYFMALQDAPGSLHFTGPGTAHFTLGSWYLSGMKLRFDTGALTAFWDVIASAHSQLTEQGNRCMCTSPCAYVPACALLYVSVCIYTEPSVSSYGGLGTQSAVTCVPHLLCFSATSRSHRETSDSHHLPSVCLVGHFQWEHTEVSEF